MIRKAGLFPIGLLFLTILGPVLAKDKPNILLIINNASFVVPYKPGYPQIMVTTYPHDDKHNTNTPGEYPVVAIDD